MLITFSNRCFPSKAIALWGRLGPADRVRLVGSYLRHAGFSEIEARDLVPEASGTDLLHAVLGRC